MSRKPRDPNTSSGQADSGRSTDYRSAGVDIAGAENALKDVSELIRGTHGPGVLRLRSGFAGAYRVPGTDRTLLASIDGVGTKLMVAARLGRYRDVGYDLVSHCVNDLLVHGGRPLFFLDYFGAGRLNRSSFREVVAGIAEACGEFGCALLGGETAEMPGLYRGEDFDLVGAIVGEVRNDELVDGSAVRPGHVLVGLGSNGLHTNGFSLARKILAEREKDDLSRPVPGTRTSWGEALLARHRSYLASVRPMVENHRITGMAHVTGGGIPGNLARALPDGTSARVAAGAWEIPPVFSALAALGRVTREGMYRTFNMGVGFVLVTRPDHADQVIRELRAAGEVAFVLGAVTRGDGGVVIKDD
jgi:phosphoribosylformylglycinamidine cyclo-ligase